MCRVDVRNSAIDEVAGKHKTHKCKVLEGAEGVKAPQKKIWFVEV